MMMRKFSRLAVGLAASGLLALGGVAATATAAAAGTIGSCSAQGQFADCAASGTANNPLTITVTVTSSPDQSVSVFWDDTCSEGTGAGDGSGSFTATTPVTRTISHPFHQPDQCIVAADGGLNNGGNSIHVSIASSSTPPPPVIHQIKGLDSKCVDDPANSSANGTKVEISTCSKTAAENWSFSNGELIHNGKCANDSGNAGSGGKVILFSCSSAENDHWTHRSNGEYVLKSHSGTLCLDDPAFSTKNGTQLEVFTCKNSSNQHWTLP
jgi:Ricin-type beta-trefoil lectin domain